MVIFPIIATLLALGCAAVVARDYLTRPKPDKVIWAIAFAMFAVAAGVEVLGSLVGWTPLLARVYYVLGATLVVGYLALGELYLLLRRTWADRAAAVMAALSALAVALVSRAPVGRDVGQRGWEALDRGTGLTTLTIGINSGGTLILLGGLLFSAWRFKQRGVMRNRMLGCVLIAAGTLAVASGGTLTRLGNHQLLYIAMAVGTALIFGGYLRARQPDAPRIAAPVAATEPAPAPLVADAPAVFQGISRPAGQTMTVSFIRAAADGQVVVPGGIAAKLGVRAGELVVLVETEDGLLVTSRERFSTRVLDNVAAALDAGGAAAPTAERPPHSNGHAEVMSERPAEQRRSWFSSAEREAKP